MNGNKCEYSGDNKQPYQIRLTKTGYFTIPEQMRGYFPDDFAIIGRDFVKGCLILYSERSWSKYYNYLRQHTQAYNREHNRYIRELISFTKKTSVRNHRVGIPIKLHALFNPNTSVVFIVDQKDKIEIWDHEPPEIDAAKD